MRLPPALLLLTLVLLTGCPRGAKTPAHVQITVDPDAETYLYNGREMGREQLWEEMRYLADRDRNKVTGNARTRVAIRSPLGVGDRAVQELTNYLISIGMNNLYYPSR